MADKSFYSFISFLRSGIANGIAGIPDPSQGAAPVGILMRAKLDARVNVRYGADAPVPLPARQLELYGPGDAVGIDRRAILRTEPRNGVTNFEPNYLAAIELLDEDFPWRLTPTAPHTDKRKLTPWLALVVLEEGELDRDAEKAPLPRDGRLPSFKLSSTADPAKIFPDAADLWAWCHVHVNKDVVGRAASGGALNDAAAVGAVAAQLDEDADYGYSRIIAPRRLAPDKGYHAFLIPAFETGRLAGLGRHEEAEQTVVNAPAWGEAGQTDFPYYHRWYFRTGAMGDFEYLVNQLKPRAADTRIGYREIVVEGIEEGGQPKPLMLPGALRPPLGTLPAETREKIEAYEDWEGSTDPHPWQADVATEMKVVSTDGEPEIAMPIYGQWHAEVEEILYSESTGALLPASRRKDWVHELNLDPRYRAIAALGTQVVQRSQEELMDAAWEQVDRIREANQKIRHQQLAIEVGKAFQKKVLSRLSDEQLLGFTVPLHRIIPAKIGASATIVKSMEGSPIFKGIGTNLFRKVTRRNWRVSKMGGNATHVFAKSAGVDINARFGVGAAQRTLTGAARVGAFGDIVAEYVTAQPGVASAGAAERSTILASLRAALSFDEGFVNGLKARTTLVRYTHAGSPFRSGGARPPADANARLFGIALENAASVRGLQAQAKTVTPVPLNLQSCKTSILRALDPRLALESRWARLFPQLGGLLGSTPLPDAVMEYPIFDLPMYLPLSELSHELFLPNINLLEQNSITLLETNQRFIEAYLVGLNHEMARELLWRGYPTDQRGSYFTRFWDAIDETTGDIAEIHTWTKKLGHNGAATGDGLLVLTLRGDLLKKYPNTVILAQKAKWDGSVDTDRILDDATEPVAPLFEAKIDPDIYFVGFQLDEAEMRGAASPSSTSDDPGWFFILQERPGEPRFGFDATATTPRTKWSDIAWSDIGTAENDLVKLSGTLPFARQGDDVQAVWPPRDSAQLAYVLYQQPVMIAVHASRLLP